MKHYLIVPLFALLLVGVGLAADKPEDAIVYSTRTGTKYHLRSCQHVRISAIPVTLKQAKELKLSPCKRCNPPVLDEPQIASAHEKTRAGWDSSRTHSSTRKPTWAGTCYQRRRTKMPATGGIVFPDTERR